MVPLLTTLLPQSMCMEIVLELNDIFEWVKFCGGIFCFRELFRSVEAYKSVGMPKNVRALSKSVGALPTAQKCIEPLHKSVRALPRSVKALPRSV